jgi:hypothetical protein
MQRVTIRARGHPNVRALHPKTIELTTEGDLTPRGTCVVAVGAELDARLLEGLEGHVVVTLDAGGVREEIRGLANPRYDASTGRLVVRRSHHRAPDTLVFDADRGSADLDRALVAALADDRAELRVTIEPDGASDEILLDVDLAAAEAVAAYLATAVTGVPGPLAFGGPLPRRGSDRRRALAATAGAVTVWRIRPQDVDAIAGELGARLVAVVTDPGTPDERVHRTPPGRVGRAASAYVVAGAVADAGVDDRLLGALLDAGVPAKTLQDALVAVTGASKRDAYERVLRCRG